MEPRYYTSADLVDRLTHVATENDRAVTFLVGSPLSVPDYVGGHGVPGVADMVDLIRREFKNTHAAIEFDQILHEDPSSRYRRAFEFLHGRRGPNVVNRIVRTAVWQALNTKYWPSHLQTRSPREADSPTCAELERHVTAWMLPRAVDLLGKLLVTCSDTFGKLVLTTNFDPLIEISVSKHGGSYYRTVLHDDGRLGQTVAKGTHIVHLHGYWHGFDTLHTPQQLIQPRPQLRSSLTRLLEATTLVVIGYSGWDDVITRTLVQSLSDSGRNPEIMWAFHQGNHRSIESSNSALLRVLEPGIGRGRVSLYKDIDCYSVLSEIYDRLKPNYPAVSPSTKGSGIGTIITESSNSGLGTRQIRIAVDLSIPDHSSTESDRPLFVDHWVGRRQELDILGSLSTPVAFLTGLGGQGKSALAGRFLKEQAILKDGIFDFWDWRDCREESDRLITQLLRLIERLSNGRITSSQLESTNIRSVIGIMFNLLHNSRALLVFDNVDQYVDLETLEPVKGLDILIAEAQARPHASLFLFTCRPDVRLDESRAMRIPLGGLSRNETRDLITICGVPLRDRHLAENLFKMTNGHPLWVRLIAMQAIRHRGGLRKALELIEKGGATLPDTTRTIWRTLNDQQRKILRTLAELDRPEPESQLFELLPGLNFNRISRALRTLRNFHLIETRTQLEGEPLLGLHPIIREFIRTEFPKQDRERYIGSILDFLDQRIKRYKPLLQDVPAYEILEHWIRKADFLIEFGHFRKAVATVDEIATPLADRGYAEEMVRLAIRLFDRVDWADACCSYQKFDVIFQDCIKNMTELGHERAESLLERYENAIAAKSSQFILLCDLQCYLNWFKGRFQVAIRWGERGECLRNDTNVDTLYSTRHNLALARRDSGIVKEALDSFLEGESIEEVVTVGHRVPDKGAAFYGNIGRCLFFLDRFDEALVCYVHSARLIEEGDKYYARKNRGYIRSWIAELLARFSRYDAAAAAYRAAECAWNGVSPCRADEVRQKLESLVGENADLRSYVDEKCWRVEAEYASWLGSQ